MGTFNQEKALVRAFSVIAKTIVKQMDLFIIFRDIHIC